MPERALSDQFFDNVRDRRILVTGGAGFLGSHMCELLARHHAKVFCLDNLSNGKEENIEALNCWNSFEFLQGDVNDGRFLSMLFREVHPEYVLHYAAMVGVNRTSRDPLGVFDDFEGIKNIARCSQKYGAKKILFTSSSEVYGEPLNTPTPEGDRLSGQWPYGLVKIVGEQYLKAFQETFGIPVTIVRFFNVYGPNQDSGESGFVVPIFLRNALSGKPLEVMGDGNQTRDFVYVADNVRLTLKAFLTPEVDGKPMNIGSGSSVRIIELARTICKILPGAKIKHRPLRQLGEIKYRMPDVQFMKQTLKDEPKIGLEQGLRLTIDSLRK